MSGLYFLIPTLMVILISMLFVRAGAIALVLTGMHYDQAKFQALSAFTATGFTTRESEKVVNHPRRRKIISTLMVGGYAGIAAVTVSGTSSLVSTAAENIPRNVIVLVAGLVLIYLLARHMGIMKRWEDVVERLLYRSSLFEFEPVDEMLHLAEGYGLVKIDVIAASPLCGQSIIQIGDIHKDALILGIERGQTWITARHTHEPLEAGDQLVIYGRLNLLKETFRAAENVQ